MRFFITALSPALIFVVGCGAYDAVKQANTMVNEGTIEEQMGPQSFNDPSIEIAGCEDAEVLSAVEAAVTVAKGYGFHYNASDSQNGRVVVNALWKGRPLSLTMRFSRKEDGLYLATKTTQPGDVLAAGGGQKIEQLFYSSLYQETTSRGLEVFGDPSARP